MVAEHNKEYLLIIIKSGNNYVTAIVEVILIEETGASMRLLVLLLLPQIRFRILKKIFSLQVHFSLPHLLVNSRKSRRERLLHKKQSKD